MPALKVKPEHIQALREATKPFLNKATRELYEEEGLSPKRYRWDALWSANRRVPTLTEVIREIYQTCNDDHIDSVLRLLVKESENA